MDGLDAEKHGQTVLDVVDPGAGPPAVDAGGAMALRATRDEEEEEF